MYRKILFLFIGVLVTGFIFMSCSDDSSTNPTPTPECKIISPNGGEVLQMGNVVKIKFENELADTVAMHLYKGENFLMDIEAMITTEDSLEWLIPTTLDVGTDYKVKIASIEDSTKFDYSDDFFAIAPAGDYIIVTSSNGGDIWLKGATKQITWYDNIAGSVNIFLVKNGIPVIDIFGTPQASSGTKSWTIPGTLADGADYKIQIVSVDNTSVNDISDSYFCLATNDNTQNIIGDWDAVGTWAKWDTVWNFNADGTFINGYEEPGTWYMTGNGIKVEFDLDTHSFLAIVNGNHLEGSMSNTAGAEGTWYADRVIPELLTPNGGEVWMHGTTQTITWDPGMFGNVVLSLADSTGIVQNIATVADTLGTYDWTIPNTVVPGAAYRIRIAKEINASAMDESNRYICIAASPASAIDILGEWEVTYNWGKGMFLMNFYSNGTFLYDEGGFTTTGTWVLTGNGLRWDFDIYSTYYLGNVNGDLMAGTMNDPGNWTAQRLLDVTAPNGGEFFQIGEPVTITWTTNITSDFVKIDLYENDVLYRTLFANNVNNYSKSWTIPSDILTSTKYKIRITSTTSDIYDESDSYFTIDGVPATPAIEDETFNDGLSQNWTGVDGIWTVVDSVYTVSSGTFGVSTAVLSAAQTGNYVFESRIRKTAGTPYNYGIVVNGDHTVLDGSGDWNNCAMLMISADGYYLFGVSVDGSWATTGWTTSSAIIPGLGEWNTIKLIVDNSTHDYHIFINGQYIETINNASFSQGEVGLKMYDGSTAGTGEFDYVKLSPVNKSALDGVKIKRTSKLLPCENVNIK
jgi:hypothetical protein